MSSPVQRPQEPATSPRNQGSNLQIVFGAILAISLLLAINFSGRIAAGQRISSDRNNMLSSISTLQAQATALQSQLNYVSSDGFIEQWARGEGKMVKGDEVLVVPVPGPMTPQPSPTPFTAPAQVASSQETQNWQLWWQLFFDSPPPSQGNGQ